MNRYWYIFRDREHARRFLCGLAVVALGWSLWQPAFGQQTVMGYTDFSCDSGGYATGNLFRADSIMNNFTTVDNSGNVTVTTPDTTYDTSGNWELQITDPLATNGACSATGLGIFGRLLCFFKETIGQIMSDMYCGMVVLLRGPILTAMTLFVVIYGIFVVTGMVEVNLKHVAKTALKLILVLLFTTHAEWGIGVGYHFFMAIAEGGATMVLSAMNNAVGGTASLTQPDALLYSIFNMVSTGTKGTGAAVAPILQSLNISGYCAATLAPLIIFMLISIPPVAIFLVIMLLMYIGLYARAVLGYLTALVLITFLFVLSPIFISFALFSITYKIFERWLQYLISYSLQMIIVFGFLAMIQLVPIGTFMLNSVALLKEYDTTFRIFFLKIPIHTCGICDITGIGNGGQSLLTSTNPPTCVSFQGGKLAPGDVMSSPDDASTASPGTVYPVIPLMNLLQHQDFVQFMLAQIIALWLIGYVMEDFLKKAPDIAKEIGAMPMALTVGGGGQSQVIGDQMTSLQYPGMESIEAGFQGFKRQFTKDPMSVLAWPRRIAGGLEGAVDGFLHGSVNTDSEESVELERQSQDVANDVADRKQKYVNAQALTRANTTAMLAQQTPQQQQAMTDYETLRNNGASQSDLRAAYDRLTPDQQKLVDYNALKADPKADPGKLRDSFGRLNPTQKTYVTATESEAQLRSELQQAMDQQDRINSKFAQTMNAGILNTQTSDGVDRGPSSLMKPLLDQYQLKQEAGDTSSDDDDGDDNSAAPPPPVPAPVKGGGGNGGNNDS
jgi:hypothetical protein